MQVLKKDLLDPRQPTYDHEVVGQHSTLERQRLRRLAVNQAGPQVGHKRVHEARGECRPRRLGPNSIGKCRLEIVDNRNRFLAETPKPR